MNYTSTFIFALITYYLFLHTIFFKQCESNSITRNSLLELFCRIPAAQCHRHRSRQACLNAQEPYCGWNEHLMKCAPAPKQNHLANHWHQEVIKCPVLTDPVDGGWSAWSAWSSCQHGTTDHAHSHSHVHLHPHTETVSP